MGTYHREIKRLADKILHKMIHLSLESRGMKGQSYNLLDILLLERIICEKEARCLGTWVKEFDLKDQLVKNAIEHLVERGDLVKEVDAHDRRRFLIKVTPQGKETGRAFENSSLEALEFVLRDMTVNEEKAVLKFLSKVNQLSVEKFQYNNPSK
ncbi:MAG: hypothetical protein AVO33_07845 [delta proteobacterium ML8_F1]|nr:MAG: hypothetical protein AVO33_07845 [delta proteobacterium ML8_F1]